MPPLSTAAANASTLAHFLVPVVPGVMHGLQGENFLIVKSCGVKADYKKERKVNPATGHCYAVIYTDFEMSYNLTAEVTGNYGLGNWHPGKRVDQVGGPGFANALEGEFGVQDGILIYEAPTKSRVPGRLPEITFTVARENATLRTDWDVVPAVETVAVKSWPVEAPPVTGVRWDVKTGTTCVFVRKFRDDPGDPWGYGIYVAPAGEKAPVNLAAFFAAEWSGGPEVTDLDEVDEVLALGAAITVLRAGEEIAKTALETTGAVPLGNV